MLRRVRPILLLIAVSVVAAAQLERIDPQLVRERIHCALESECPLDMAGRAKGIHRSRVEVHERLARADVGAAIQLVVDLRRAGVPTAVSVGHRHLGDDTNERSIVPGGQGHALHRGGAITRVGLLALAIKNTTHRPAGLSRERDCGIGVRCREVFRPEPAAHVVLHHTHAIERKPECARDVLPHLKDPLRALPYRDVVAEPLSHRAMGFDCRVQRAGRTILASDRDVGARDGRVGVTPRGQARLVARNVARGAHQWRAGCERHRKRYRVRRAFHVELDERARRPRKLCGVGAERGERLTRPMDHRIEQRRAHVHDAWHVGRHERAANARQRERRREIHAYDSATRDGRPQKGRVQHGGVVQIGRVARAARDLLECIRARDALADNGQRRVVAPRFGLEVRPLDDLDLFAAFDLDLGADKTLRAGRRQAVLAIASAIRARIGGRGCTLAGGRRGSAPSGHLSRPRIPLPCPRA